MTTYPPTIKEMARCISTQYPNNKPAHQCNGKKGDKKKGDDSKSEDKHSNMGATAGAHVEDTTSREESTAPSGGFGIGAHVLETKQQFSCRSRTVEEILGAHPIDNRVGLTPMTHLLIQQITKNMMTESHIMEQRTYKYQEPAPPELLNVVTKKPQTYNLAQNYQLDSWNKFKDLNILSKTNNVTHTNSTDLLSQENQDYYNYYDQQFIARKYDGSLEQVTIELVPQIVLEEEEDAFYQDIPLVFKIGRKHDQKSKC